MATRKDKSLEKLDSASKRLKYVIDSLGVKQSRMASKLGLSPSGLHYILNNEIKFSKNAKKIAGYLNVNEKWLTSGQGEIYNENMDIKTYKIPVYFLEQLKLFYKTNQKSKITADDYLITATDYKNNVFGIYVTDTEFSSKFEVSDIVVFEQVDSFTDGEIILAYLAQTNTIAMKKGLHIENKIILFSPIENKIIKMVPNQGDLIIGAYRECRKKSTITTE